MRRVGSVTAGNRSTSRCSRETACGPFVGPFVGRSWAAAVLLMLASLYVSQARAEWFERTEDGIMGTRIAVELWADDRSLAE